MKLSICLTVALTALSVAAAPSLGSPVLHLQERGGFGAAAGLVKAASKFSHHVPKPHHQVPHKTPNYKPSHYRPIRKPPHPAPHKPTRGRPQIRLPPQHRPAPKPQSRPPPPPPSNSDPFSDVGGMLNDAASQNEPHFNVGSLFRRDGVYYYIE